MPSDSQLMSELSHRTHFLRELTPDEQRQLKNVMLDIYKSVARICDEHGLTYMMSGGTCLGTIRHQGYIPWDDDLDIMMPRADYNKLIELCHQGILGEKYEFSYPNSKTDANNVYLKIFRKNSKYVELATINTPFPKGIFIDVFPIECMPSSKLTRTIRSVFANGVELLALARLYAQYPSEPLKQYSSYNKQLRRRYALKKTLGKLAAFAPHKKWIYWFDRLASSSKDSQTWGIPSGRKYYDGETFDKSVFVPTKKAMFEGLEVYVPNDTDSYLRNLYGDYMTLPPVEKRERHFVYDLKLPED